MIRPGFLDSESRRDLIELARDGSAAHRLARRANALVLLDKGMSCQSIAEVLFLDNDTIRTWYQLYQEDGIEGLASFGHEGGSCRLAVEQQDKLKAWIGETLPRSTRAVGAWIARECGIEIWQDTDILDGPGHGLTSSMDCLETTLMVLCGTLLTLRLTPIPAVASTFIAFPTVVWYIVGGTSVASPALAGIVNNANNRFGNAALTPPGFYTSEEDNYVYSQIDSWLYPTNWYQVISGDNGACESGICPSPSYIYNECTGMGTPRGKLGK